MNRVWDWIVGISMIAIALLVGAIVSGLVAMPLTVGIDAILHSESTLTSVCSWLFVLILLNVLGFVDYYRLRRVNRAGIFHFIPRAIERIRHGHELSNAVDAYTGKPVDVQAPIRAGGRLVTGICVVLASLGGVAWMMSSNSAESVVGGAAGFLGTIIGLVIVIQALLAYAGLIRRKPSMVLSENKRN